MKRKPNIDRLKIKSSLLKRVIAGVKEFIKAIGKVK